MASWAEEEEGDDAEVDGPGPVTERGLMAERAAAAGEAPTAGGGGRGGRAAVAGTSGHSAVTVAVDAIAEDIGGGGGGGGRDIVGDRKKMKLAVRRKLYQ